MESKNILVLGGKGKTGRRVVSRLVKLGHNVRIGSRSESPAFDWDNPDSWPLALEGMDMAYITFQPDLAVPGAYDTIKGFTTEAIKAGIKKLVLLSGKGEVEAERCEEVVMNAGADWTIVRASWFNQNFSESFFLDPILAGHVALPKNEALVPYVDADDIADVVVATLLSDAHNGKVYQLTGPRQLTFEQVTAEIAKATGRDIQFESITMDQYTAMLREYQLPESYIWLINYLFTEVLTESNSIVTNDVERVLGRKAKDFSEYTRDTAMSGVWHPVVEQKVEATPANMG